MQVYEWRVPQQSPPPFRRDTDITGIFRVGTEILLFLRERRDQLFESRFASITSSLAGVFPRTLEIMEGVSTKASLSPNSQIDHGLVASGAQAQPGTPAPTSHSNGIPSFYSFALVHCPNRPKPLSLPLGPVHAPRKNQ